jgi:hypothetical protein
MASDATMWLSGLTGKNIAEGKKEGVEKVWTG